MLVARFDNFFRVESKNAESKHFPFDWGNSLIGNFALIKDMNPKLQVRSKNPGASPKIQGGGLLQHLSQKSPPGPTGSKVSI